MAKAASWLSHASQCRRHTSATQSCCEPVGCYNLRRRKAATSMSTLRKIHCQCGQSFTERTLDGEARMSCPVCKRPIPLAEPKEALLVAELVESEPDVAERWLEGYRPTLVTDFVSPNAK